ncbi:unnamed protein product, partial [Sphagnum tenellum]
YSLIDFDDMSKYTLTKIYSITLLKNHTSSLPRGHPRTMSLFNQTLIQKSTIVNAPCVQTKKSFWRIINNLAPSFKH